MDKFHMIALLLYQSVCVLPAVHDNRFKGC